MFGIHTKGKHPGISGPIKQTSDSVNPFLHFVAFCEKKFFHWIDAHSLADTEHQLIRQRLYIFPSFRGFQLLAIILILWLLGTNYQNNIILAFAFLLISMFVIAILHTFANMLGLRIAYKGASPAFAGDEVHFTFSVYNNKKRFVENIDLCWQHGDKIICANDIPPQEPIAIKVPLNSHTRGWFRPGRLLVQSYYPLGLFRCWTWLNWNVAALIYPKPVAVPPPRAFVADSEGNSSHETHGGDDFGGLKEYRPGDSLKHIAWKSYARDKGLFSKEFSQSTSLELWLDYSSIGGRDVEERLSGLCYWAIAYDRRDEDYGLKLREQEINPARGENHRRTVLEALAMFNPN